MARRGPALFSLPRKQLLPTSEFQAVFQQRRHRVERVDFVAVWRPRAGVGRVGFAVSRKIGGSVVRNRARRRLREAYRRAQAAFGAGFDVVFIGRAAVVRRPLEELVSEIGHTLRVVSRDASAERP